MSNNALFKPHEERQKKDIHIELFLFALYVSHLCITCLPFLLAVLYVRCSYYCRLANKHRRLFVNITYREG